MKILIFRLGFCFVAAFSAVRLPRREWASTFSPAVRIPRSIFYKVTPSIHPSYYSFPSTTMLAGKQEKHASAESNSPTMSIRMHHTAIKTRNISTAIQFYGLFGWRVSCQFRAGPARAAWLEPSENDGGTTRPPSSSSSRLELIEVPAYMMSEDLPGIRRRAWNMMEHPASLGFFHLALDVTEQIQQQGRHNLTCWLEHLNATSVSAFSKSLRVALSPRQQIMGNAVYELAMIYDADGCLVELLHKKCDLQQSVSSGWDPWDGEGFVGGNMVG